MGEVAALLVDAVTAGPGGRLPDAGGPEVQTLGEMARLWRQVRGLRRPVVPLRLPGATGRAMATGGLLPTGPGPRGSVTFTAWLAEQTG